jgi:ppGpp synthetase/RelA/SpoT-type nucleotidyltranferase
MIKPFSASDLLFSKGDVRRAGELVTGEKVERDGTAFQQAMRIIEQWRALHLYPLNTFQALLRKKLVDADIKEPLLAQRLKKMSTMLGKLARIEGGLDSMQDIAGIRIVFSSLSELRAFEKTLRSSRFKHVIKNSKDYIVDPKKDDAYRAVHLIYRCHSKKKNTPSILDGLMVEVQLRTRLQHYWATAVEAVDMFYGQTLKFGQGEKAWQHFFALSSAAFAFEEKTALPTQFQGFTREDILHQLKAADKAINAITRLNAITKLALPSDVKKDKVEKFYLLMLSKEAQDNKGSIRVMTFDANMEDAANHWYQKLEQSPDIDVVLVRTTGAQLAKLYSNYFLDITEFLKALKRVPLY